MATETVNITTTLADDSVTNAKLAEAPEATIKLVPVGSGTSNPVDGDADQASEILDAATDPFARTSALAAYVQDGDTVTSLTFQQGGLRLKATAPSTFVASMTYDEVATGNRILNLDLNDANRRLTISADADISGTNTGDQDLSAYVQGPASSTNNNIPQWDGTTGKLLKDGLGTSTGGNEATDSGKVLTFNTQGQIQGSAAGSALAAVKGTASSSSYAVHGEAASGIGVYGQSSSGPGVAADSVTGKAISAVTLGPTEPVMLVKNANAANTAPLAEFHRNDNTGLHVLNDGGLNWDTATGAQTTASNLPVFGAATKGVVPAAGAVPSADNYLRETGVFASLAADVRAVVLTGLSLASSAAVAATDTILAAFGKLQAFNNLFTTIGLAYARLTNPGAVTFPRQNADNTVTSRTASEMRTDLGLGNAALVDMQRVVMGSNFTTSSTTYVDLTGLAVTLDANSTYWISIVVPYSTPSSSTGTGLSITCTNSPTLISASRYNQNQSGNGVGANVNANDAGPITATVQAPSTNYVHVLTGIIITSGSSSVLQARFARGGTYNTCTAYAGASILAVKIS